jgi:hypothetical protein
LRTGTRCIFVSLNAVTSANVVDRALAAMLISPLRAAVVPAVLLLSVA